MRYGKSRPMGPTGCSEAVQKKASSTPRDSQAVPHPSTNRALRCLTAEFGRDPVFSTRYGRWRKINLNDILKRCNVIYSGRNYTPFPHDARANKRLD